MPTPREHLLAEVHDRLGYRPLSRAWAKAEIALGLVAAGIGLLLGVWAVARSAEPAWTVATLGVALFALGGYLTLAGHRSHLYQSENERLALLVEEIRRTGNDTVVSPSR